jgi:ribosomal-protein-alanine N-acetyltransferase
MRLNCGSCVVREWREDDRDSLVRSANNRNIWRNMAHRFPYPYTAKAADSWFDVLAGMQEPTHWAIEVDSRAVGGIGVDLGEGVFEKTGHFGYWLAESCWGRGIMTAAARAVSDHALSRLGLRRLEARVYAWNPASMRVLEKSGFVREALLRCSVFKDGELIDSVLYARVQ